MVCIPTDTVYGLAACVSLEEAVEKVFHIKGRPKSSPMPVLLKTIEQMNRYVSEIPLTAQILAEHYWPGPLTVILKKSSCLSSLVTAGLDTAGFRIPGHHVPLELCDRTKDAIIGTSANKSGEPAATNIEEAINQLSEYPVDLFLDGGPSGSYSHSTIIDSSKEPANVLREGALSKKELFKTMESRGVD